MRALAFTAILVSISPATRADSFLQGRVVDALDGRSLEGARILVRGREAVTDDTGSFRIAIEAGVYRLYVEHPSHRPAEVAQQHASADPRGSVIHLWPREFPQEFIPTENTFGVGRGTGPGPGYGPARLPGTPFLAPVPAELPETIRVARYRTVGCSGTYDSIDTIDFEDYVKGVVNAEVGVFAGVDGGPDAAAECWKAFAVAARSYALHFVLTKPYDGYDINDTACNQVYKDERNADVSRAVEATRGQILVKAADPDVLDRYFYAASCAEHGTEPAYGGGEILPDPTPVRACVGSWCGHDDCNGHADNPNLAGDDKCLVWGTCQWGSVERSMHGDSYVQILNHYQPYCIIRSFGQQEEEPVQDEPDAGTDADNDAGADKITGADADKETGGCGCGHSSSGLSILLVLALILFRMTPACRSQNDTRPPQPPPGRQTRPSVRRRRPRIASRHWNKTLSTTNRGQNDPLR